MSYDNMHLEYLEIFSEESHSNCVLGNTSQSVQVYFLLLPNKQLVFSGNGISFARNGERPCEYTSRCGDRKFCP